MIKWYKSLYLGESIKDKSRQLKFYITYGKKKRGHTALPLRAMAVTFLKSTGVKNCLKRFIKNRNFLVIAAGGKGRGFRGCADYCG